MAESGVQVIKQDLGFIRQIMDNGGDTLKKCFQCGNCTAVCEVTQETAPFPRKEMVWAQWGLKDKLLTDPNIWICHQCNDCTTHCPRGAKPGDVFAAVRNISFEHYGAFGLGRFFTSLKFVPFLALIPAVIILAVISLASKTGFLAEQKIVFSNMMPVPAIDVVFLPSVFFAVVATLLSVMKFWKAMKAGSDGDGPSTGSIIPAVISVVTGVLTHDKMRKCGTNAPRATSHLALMYGFIALVITTSAVAGMYWINKLSLRVVAQTPLELDHPVKILGNLGALLAFAGISLIIFRRFGPSKEAAGSTAFYDHFFLTVVFWTVVTGILAEVIRLMDMAVPAFTTYYIHLVFVFMLLIYAPYSKFAHMIYRFTALVYANATQRERVNGS